MLSEGRIETTVYQEILLLQVTLSLDMAEERRLLDQRITLETNSQVVSLLLIVRAFSSVAGYSTALTSQISS